MLFYYVVKLENVSYTEIENIKTFAKIVEKTTGLPSLPKHRTTEKSKRNTHRALTIESKLRIY